MEANEMSDYASVTAHAEYLNNLIRPYAEQVVEALANMGVAAELQVTEGGRNILGLVPDTHIIAVPAAQYEYLVNEQTVLRHGNPGTTASQIVSNMRHAGYRPPAIEEGTEEQAVAQPSGESGTTVTPNPVTSQPTPNPSSGTVPIIVPTINTSLSLKNQLASIMDANGYDPNLTYGGYQWAWFHERTSFYYGFPVGPRELGISEDTLIGIDEAVRRITAYLMSMMRPGESTPSLPPDPEASEPPPAGTTEILPPGSSGTSRTGLAGQLEVVMRNEGHDPNGLFNGYGWSYFFQRTPSYNGQTIGPADLALSENETIGIDVAAQRLEALMATGSTPGDSTPEKEPAKSETGKLLALGGMILVILLLTRVISV